MRKSFRHHNSAPKKRIPAFILGIGAWWRAETRRSSSGRVLALNPTSAIYQLVTVDKRAPPVRVSALRVTEQGGGKHFRTAEAVRMCT